MHVNFIWKILQLVRTIDRTKRPGQKYKGLLEDRVRSRVL